MSNDEESESDDDMDFNDIGETTQKGKVNMIPVS